jgi:hypothetical protein
MSAVIKVTGYENKERSFAFWVIMKSFESEGDDNSSVKLMGVNMQECVLVITKETKKVRFSLQLNFWANNIKLGTQVTDQESNEVFCTISIS